MELNEHFFYGLLLMYIFFFIIIESVIFVKLKPDFNREENLKKKKQARKNIVVFLLFTVLPPWLIPLLYSFIVIRPFIKVISFVILFFSVSFAIALSTQIWMYIKLQRMKFDESARDIEN